MGEIVYKLFFFIILSLFLSFAFLIKVKLEYWKNYHGLDFISIDKDFQISTGGYDSRTKNIIYVNTIPNDCKNENKNSIKCLVALKKEGGMYNGLLFFSGTNTYK